MKAIIRLECIGDNISEMSRLFSAKCDFAIPGFGKYMVGRQLSPWVAEIVGISSKFKYEREFLRYNKDYSESNSAGSRGIYKIYVVESDHVYEAFNLVSWSSNERFFFKVNGEGDIVKITENEVQEWLKNH